MNPLYPLVGLGFGLLLMAGRKSDPAATASDIDVKNTLLPDAPGGGGGLPSQSTYVQAARDGKLELRWVKLPSAPDWEVTSDAVKLNGVRFPVTARTAQQIADILGWGARFTTPLVEDLIQTDAAVKIVSPTWDYKTMFTPEAVSGFNTKIDAQVGDQEGLVSCVGKSWVLTNEMLTRTLKEGIVACNYGMFRTDGPYLSITNKYKLWQQPGYRHNIDHWDYSQVLRLCRPIKTGAVIPSHDGVKISRQPGVDKVS